MFAVLLVILGWSLLAIGAACIGAAMAQGTSSAKIAGWKVNIIFTGFTSFIIGLVLISVSTGMVTS